MKVQEWAESILCQQWEFCNICRTVIVAVGCFSCSGSSLSLELRPWRKFGG
ncbi:hypothetical protein AtNW77_Chr2g0229251 [Arabidopsis thaliana]